MLTLEQVEGWDDGDVVERVLLRCPFGQSHPDDCACTNERAALADAIEAFVAEVR
jgi:hypothetical protein